MRLENTQLKTLVIALMYFVAGALLSALATRWQIRQAHEREGNRPLLDAFDIWYHEKNLSETNMPMWLGHPFWKCPLDAWAYQEVIFETKPDVLVESGTYKGGSALFFASIFDLLGHGRVLTIDIEDFHPPQHPRIVYLLGSSTSNEIFQRVKSSIRPGERVMVSLDSDHHKDHVLSELKLYGPLVTPGCYMVTEDTDINGHPLVDSWGPGPMEAVEEYLKTNPGFTQDRSREKAGPVMFAGGWLKKLR
jgi:cephalosporin hydroxylase